MGYVNAPVVLVDLVCGPQATNLHNDKDEQDAQNPSVQCLFFFCSCCASWCRSKALRARTPPVDCLNLVQAPRVEDDGIQAETEETCSWRYNI